MAQGKFKKTKLPTGNKKKQVKNNAFTRRSNAPIQPKKTKFTENQKIKQVITKSVNKSMESELRGLAQEGQLKLTKAQEAVAKHHQTVANEQKPSTSKGSSN